MTKLSLSGWLNRWLTVWLTDWLAHQHVDWLADGQVDCTIIETWLNGGASATIAQWSVAGYIFKNFPRQSMRRGDGTGILYRESLS